MSKILELLEKYLLYLVLFSVPVAVLGIFANPFEVPKVAILIFGVCLLLLVFSLKILVKKTLSFSTHTFDIPVLFLGITYLVSSIWQTPNKMEAFLVPGVASVIIFAALFYFFLNHVGEVKRSIGTILTISGALTSLVSLLAYSGVLAKISFLPNYAKSVYFNLAGGYLPQILMLIVILPLSISLI